MRTFMWALIHFNKRNPLPSIFNWPFLIRTFSKFKFLKKLMLTWLLWACHLITIRVHPFSKVRFFSKVFFFEIFTLDWIIGIRPCKFQILIFLKKFSEKKGVTRGLQNTLLISLYLATDSSIWFLSGTRTWFQLFFYFCRFQCFWVFSVKLADNFEWIKIIQSLPPTGTPYCNIFGQCDVKIWW